MSEAFDPWPMPRYGIVAPKHVHALGVISLNYNQYEHTLFGIFAHPFRRLKVPLTVPEHIFSEFGMQQKTEAIKHCYIAMEPEDSTRGAVDHLLQHFGWCFEARNLLLHAHENQIGRSIADIFTEEATRKLPLAKPKKGSTTSLNFMYLTLPHLRAIADAMYDGYQYALDLWAYINQRDGLLPSSFPKELSYLLPKALPHKPQIPKRIKLLDRPVTHEE